MRQSQLTVGRIAERLAQPVHKVLYLLRARKVRPASWAGNCRVFTEADLDYVAAEISRIARDRGAQ